MSKTYKDDEYVHWNNNVKDDYGNKSDEVRQMNIKDINTGDHYFHEVSSGKQGVALGDYRPERDDNNNNNNKN